MPQIEHVRLAFRPNQYFPTSLLSNTDQLTTLHLYFKNYMGADARNYETVNGTTTLVRFPRNLTGFKVPSKIQVLSISNTGGDLYLPDGFFAHCTNLSVWHVESTPNFQNILSSGAWQRLGLKSKDVIDLSTGRYDLFEDGVPPFRTDSLSSNCGHLCN